MAIVAAVGDFRRFDDPDRLVAYVGLNPKVRQSGNSAPVHGRISKAGWAQVRGVLVEAAWSASRAPGPLRAFFQRIKARRGFQTAVVATARNRPRVASGDQRSGVRVRAAKSGVAQAAQTRARCRRPSRRGNHRIPGAAYNDKQRRNEEKQIAEQAGRAYEVFVAHWQPTKPTGTRAPL
jgi:transposase